MICAGSALPKVLKSSKPLLSLAPASLSCLSVDLALCIALRSRTPETPRLGGASIPPWAAPDLVRVPASERHFQGTAYRGTQLPRPPHPTARSRAAKREATALTRRSAPRPCRRRLGDVGELALEGGGGRQAVQPFHLGRGGDERGVGACAAPLTTNEAPGSVWKVAAILRSGLKSCAQAARPRRVRIASVIAQDLSVRRPSSLRGAVTLLAA